MAKGLLDNWELSQVKYRVKQYFNDLDILNPGEQLKKIDELKLLTADHLSLEEKAENILSYFGFEHLKEKINEHKEFNIFIDNLINEDKRRN